MPERLECEVLQKARYINTLTFTFKFMGLRFIPILAPFSSYLTLNNTVTLKFRLRVTYDH